MRTILGFIPNNVKQLTFKASTIQDTHHKIIRRNKDMIFKPGTIDIYKFNSLNGDNLYRIEFNYGHSPSYHTTLHREEFIEQWDVDNVDYWKQEIDKNYEYVDNRYYIINNYNRFRNKFEAKKKFEFKIPQLNIKWVIGLLTIGFLITTFLSKYEVTFDQSHSQQQSN